MAWYDQTVEFLSDSIANPRTQVPLLAVTGASFTLGLLLRSLLPQGHPEGIVLPSPRNKVLSLSDAEKRELPLPTDVLPGARDVSTPYGSIRVYEWGPEDGPKVLFVHGITTPCIALGGVAHDLVDKGCRVILFDLYVTAFSLSDLLILSNCCIISLMSWNLGLEEVTLTAPLTSLKMTDSLRVKSFSP